MRPRDRNLRDLAERVGPGDVDRLGLAPELLDAPRDLAPVAPSLGEMVAQTPRVRSAAGQAEVSLQRHLEPPLGPIGLVEVTDELRGSHWKICHVCSLVRVVC